MTPLQDSQVTVVGGGALGAAALYFLSEAGFRDIQLLESHDPAARTTSQAAGIVGQVRSTVQGCRVSMASADLYRSMESRFGVGADWRETGSLRIALSERSAAEVRRVADVASSAGLEVELLDAAALQAHFPALEDVRDVRIALWCPTDGYIQPNSVTAAYLAAAKMNGARVVPHTPVRGILVDGGRVQGVITDRGTVRSEVVINAAGPWAGALARTVGLELPIVPVLVQYFVTGPKPGWDFASPVLRVPEIQLYARGEGDGVLVGGFENRCTSLDPRGVKLGTELPRTEEWDALAHFGQSLERLVPSIGDAGIRAVFTGWPGFTPDGGFLIGPVAVLPGLVMFAGCNAHGVQGSEALGRLLVDSLGPDPSPAAREASPNRFVPRDWEWDAARMRAANVCANYYPAAD